MFNFIKKTILNAYEKDFQKEHFLFLISIFFLRDLLESALEGDFKIFRTPSLYDSLLFTIHHLFFYSSLFLILVISVSLILKEKKEKVLTLFTYFSFLLLLAPLIDFIFGGGKMLAYPTSIKNLLISLFKGEFERENISKGQVIEVFIICFFISIYVFFKSENILKSIFSFVFSFFIVITVGGIPGYFLNYFSEGGYIFDYNSKQGLFYAILTISLIPFIFKIKIKYNEILSFSIWGYLSAIIKILYLKTKYDITSLYFPFDYISIIILPVFVLIENKKNIFYITISLMTVFLLGELPFIFFTIFIFFDNTFLNKKIKNFIMANLIFLSGSSIFFGNFSHLIYPYLYPFLLTFLLFIKNNKIREILLNSTFLILTFLFSNRSFWVSKENLKEIFVLKSSERDIYLFEKYKDISKGVKILNFLIKIKNYEKIPELLTKFKKEKSPGNYYFYRALAGAMFNEDILEVENLSIVSLITGNPLALPLIVKIYELKGEYKKAEIFLKRSLKHNIKYEYNSF